MPKWQANRLRKKKWPATQKKNSKLRAKYGVEWWKADPTLRKERH